MIEAPFLPIEGLPGREEPHDHATAFGLARVKLEHGTQGVVSLLHPEAFESPQWEVLRPQTKL